MKKKLLNNWVAKVISLLFAFTLWFLVINVTDPTDNKDFSNIPVKLINTDALDEDKVFEILDGTGVVRNVNVIARTSVLRDLTESDIVAEADFNKLTATQTIEIDFYTTRSNNEIDKIKGNIGFVKLNIEDKKTKYLTLQVEVNGKVSDGFILNRVVPEQNRITITGPESIIDTIHSAVVQVDVSEAMDNITTKSNVILYNDKGKEVTSESLSTSFQTVAVSAVVDATKWLPIQLSVSGKPEEGYCYTGELTSTTSRVLVSGSKEALRDLDYLEIPKEILDLTGKTKDFVVALNIQDYLPEGVSLVNEKTDTQMAVTVHIEKEYEKEYRVLPSQIRITDLPLEYQARIEHQSEYTLILAGLQRNLNAIHEEQLSGTVSIRDLMSVENMDVLKAGTYRMKVDFDLSDEMEVVGPVVVQLVVTQ